MRAAGPCLDYLESGQHQLWSTPKINCQIPQSFWKFYFLIFEFIPAGPPAGALRGKLLKELRKFFPHF